MTSRTVSVGAKSASPAQDSQYQNVGPGSRVIGGDTIHNRTQNTLFRKKFTFFELERTLVPLFTKKTMKTPNMSPITYLVSAKFENMAFSHNIAELESDRSGATSSR
ncbi:hypothetical protein AK95_08380 [Paenibacillus sp. LC231]|nr:hypothetical protein AK95_08380 [Paenibacillus sp. LC231]